VEHSGFPGKPEVAGHGVRASGISRPQGCRERGIFALTRNIAGRTSMADDTDIFEIHPHDAVDAPPEICIDSQHRSRLPIW
jgi:hypothetical protein